MSPPPPYFVIPQSVYSSIVVRCLVRCTLLFILPHPSVHRPPHYCLFPLFLPPGLPHAVTGALRLSSSLQNASAGLIGSPLSASKVSPLALSTTWGSVYSLRSDHYHFHTGYSNLAARTWGSQGPAAHGSSINQVPPSGLPTAH